MSEGSKNATAHKTMGGKSVLYVGNIMVAHLLNIVNYFFGGGTMILENIKRRCSEQGITLCFLEKEVGIGNGVIAKWKTNSPRIDLLKKVADYFDCSVDDLLREV